MYEGEDYLRKLLESQINLDWLYKIDLGDSLFFDKDGQPISLDQLIQLQELPEDYSRVGSTYVKGMWISTVWLGINHSYTRHNK